MERIGVCIIYMNGEEIYEVNEGGRMKVMRYFFIYAIFMASLHGEQTGMDWNSIPRDGVISGYVYDSESGVPLEYASVILYSARDSSQMAGTSTNAKGYFRLTGLRPGMYYLEVDFIGYKKRIVGPVKLVPPELQFNAGRILLEPAPLSLPSVKVKGEKPEIVYKVDKKVVYVGKNSTDIAGTAVDVLEKVPSVNVDVDGNLQLRGSGDFKVFIDNKPTILDPNEVLHQIPASSIERIELITNPSAKYDPEGVAGIINIVLNKNNKKGISGMISLNGGLNNKYGGDILLSKRDKKYGIFIGLNYNHSDFNGTMETERKTFYQGDTSYVSGDGDVIRRRIPAGVKAGLDLYFDPWNTLSMGANFGQWEMGKSSEVQYEEVDTTNQTFSYTSLDTFEIIVPFFSITGTFQHKFFNEDHKLTFDIYYSQKKKEKNNWNELIGENDSIISGEISKESGPVYHRHASINYVLPFGEKNKLETGYEVKFNNSISEKDVYNYDPEAGDFILQPNLKQNREYFKNIHSLYGLYSSDGKSLGYQAGIRLEYTYRKISVIDSSAEFTIDRFDYFPSFHLSYRFKNSLQFMTGYSRRIRRPRGWELEPFLTWFDSYNVFRGNPQLLPEYIDSYELGFQNPIGRRNMLSAELYYRVIHNKIERIQSFYEDNVLSHTFENVGTEQSGGIEVMLNLTLLPFLRMNWTGDIYYHKLSGEYEGTDFSNEGFNWNLRMRNNLHITKTTLLQATFMYHSPTETSQGTREGFFVLDVAARQTFFRSLTVTFKVRDILKSGKFEFNSEDENFTSHQVFTREAPLFTFNIRYNFNNYRAEKKMKQEKEIDEEEIGF